MCRALSRPLARGGRMSIIVSEEADFEILTGPRDGDINNTVLEYLHK